LSNPVIRYVSQLAIASNSITIIRVGAVSVGKYR
jgi:hypothetical protein